MVKTRSQSLISHSDHMSMNATEPVIDPQILAAIRQAVKEEIGTKLQDISDALGKIAKLSERVDTIEKGLQFSSERLDSLAKVALPGITTHMAQLAESLTMYNLQIDAHRRKWNLVLHGLEGPAKEAESSTRDACLTFAKDVLKVPNAKST